MDFASMSPAFDIAVTVLLVVFIGYAFVLNRKLTLLRDGKDDMARLALDLGASMDKAQQNLEALKEAASGKAEALQVQLDRADSLADDLAFLVRKSDIAAQKMDRARVRSRNPLAQDPAPFSDPSPVRTNIGRPDANAGRPAGQAPATVVAPQGARPLAEKLEEARARAGGSIGEGGSAFDSEPASPTDAALPTASIASAKTTPRSEEENQLLKVLQGMR